MIMIALAAGGLCASMASAQTAANLVTVSGNGQVVCPNCPSDPVFAFAPLIVKATDQFGNPVPGVTVNWAITSGFGTLSQGGSTYTASTDSNGMASVLFQFGNEGSGNGLGSTSQYTITATAGSLVNTFYLTQGLQDPNSSQLPVKANQQNNSLLTGFNYTGQLGSTGQTPFSIFVSDEGGRGVPNVAVFLVDAQTITSQAAGPTILCAGAAGAGTNVVMTDATGIVNCYPVYGGTTGTGQFYVDVGGAQTTISGVPSSFLTIPFNALNIYTGVINGYNFQVTPGAPGSTTVVSGSSQSATPGQALGQPLVAAVLNASGQPLSGISVNWTVSPANAATLTPTTTTGANGQTSNTVTLTSTASGAITVTATASGTSSQAIFSISAIPLVTVTSFQIVSGNNQSANVNNTFAQPLVVQLTTSNGTASGITVAFKVQSGSISLSSASAVTNASGQAQVTVTAGSVPGAASVLASITSTSGSSTQTFSLTVLPQGPSISAANFYNAADLQPNSFSPCGLGLLLGAGSLGVNSVAPLFPGLPAPQTAVTITFNSISAPILNIGNNAQGQQFILFQVPCELSPASAVPVVVNIAGSTSNVNLNVQAAAPGVFHTVMSDGVARAVLVRPDGSFVSLTNPARRGETEIAYVTGLGATTPSVATTALPVPGGTPSMVLGTVVPGMNGGGLQLVSAQLSEDLPGIYLVSFQIPANEATGNNVPFSIGVIPVGGSTAFYSALTTVPVQ